MFLAAAYFIFLWPVLSDTSVFQVHDNLKGHQPLFLYYAHSLYHGFGLPLWHHSYGGTPVGMTAILSMPLLPHRLISYAFFAVSSLSPLTVYKVNLYIGILLPCLGWWLVLRQLTRSRVSATIGGLMLLWGGSGMTVFQHEHIIATMFWFPWVILAALHSVRRRKLILSLAVLAGIMMTSSYPQLHLMWIFFLGLVVACVAGLRQCVRRMVTAPFPKALYLVALVLLILAMLPVFYMYAHVSEFSSPVREAAELKIDNLEQFLVNNRMQRSSVPWAYLANYFHPRSDVFLDQYLFFVTRTGVVLAWIGLVFYFRRTWVVGVVTLIAAWLTLGIHGYLAHILFLVRFPFVSIFRQWYHFTPLLNFCLSALGAFGISFILRAVRTQSQTMSVNARRALLAAILAFVTGIMAVEARWYLGEYQRNVLPRMPDGGNMKPWTKEEYLQLVKGDQLFINLNEALFVHKEWFELMRMCPDLMYRRPLSTRVVYNAAALTGAKKEEIFKAFAELGMSRYAVIATLSAEQARGLLAQGIDVRVLSSVSELEDWVIPSSGENYFFPEQQYGVSPKDATLEAEEPEPSFILLPFAYRLGLKIDINGKVVPSYPVYGGAFTGIMGPAGKFSLRAAMPVSFYHIAVLLQYLLLLLALGVAIYDFRKSPWPWLEGGIDESEELKSCETAAFEELLPLVDEPLSVQPAPAENVEPSPAQTVSAAENVEPNAAIAAQEPEEVEEVFVVTPDQMRQLEAKAVRACGVSLETLMENAGKAVASVVMEEYGRDRDVVCVCGKGHNGGDGFVCARHLILAGVRTKVVYVGQIFPDKGPSAVAFQSLVKMGAPVHQVWSKKDLAGVTGILGGAGVIVDALFGIGLNADVIFPYDEVIRLMNGSPAQVVAVDIPSGLDAQTGQWRGVCVDADVTVALGCLKTGMTVGHAEESCGRVVVRDIGIPQELFV